MKKYIYAIIGLALMISLTLVIVLPKKPQLTLVGVSSEITHIISEPIPNLLEDVYGIINDKGKVDLTVDSSLVKWNSVGKYKVNYKYKNKVVGKTTVNVHHEKPYIVNTIDLIYNLELDIKLDYFITDIKAYDIYGKDITYNKNGDLRISVNDVAVDYLKVGNYQAQYIIADDYNNENEKNINVQVRKSSNEPVIYGCEDTLYIKLNSVIDKNKMLEGITAYTKDALNITNQIIVDDSIVNSTIEGRYIASYLLGDGGFLTTISREVIVINSESPLIIGVPEYLLVELGNDLIDLYQGVSSYDFSDFNITNNLELLCKVKGTNEVFSIEKFYDTYINEPGDYYIIYKSVNSLENTSYKELFVKVINDVELPIIEGTKDIAHSAGDGIPDFLNGVSASKIYDEMIVIDLTESIKVKIKNKKTNGEHKINDIDYNLLDSYLIIYSVVDQSGNEKTLQQNLYIIDVDKPVFYNVPESFTYYLNPPSGEPSNLPDYLEEVVAWDYIDGELTNFIDVYDFVDYTVPGDYYIEYKVSDNTGNTAIKTVIVHVISS